MTVPATDARPTGRTVGRAVEIAADVLARHLAAGGRRWLLDLRDPHDGEPADLDTAALAAALDRIGTTDVLVGPAGIARLRAEASPQDVLLLLAPTALAREACLRAQAWGVATVLLPIDHGDARGVADVVLPAGTGEQLVDTLREIGQRLADTGAVPGPRATGERGEVCITCADEATVCEVAEVLDPVLVRAHTPDGLVEVDTTLVEPVAVHDLLLVHARTAIARLDPTLQVTDTQDRGPR